MHTYRKSKGEDVWTVGFEMWSDTVTAWRAIKDFNTEAAAAAYTAYLNGGEKPRPLELIPPKKKLNTDELLNTAAEIADEIDEADGKAAAEQYTDTDELWQQLRRWAQRLRDAVHNQP